MIHLCLILSRPTFRRGHAATASWCVRHRRVVLAAWLLALFIGAIVGLSFIVLAVVFRSLVIPLTARLGGEPAAAWLRLPWHCPPDGARHP